MMEAELVLDERMELGEGPAWDADAGVLYFVDIHAGRLHRYQHDHDEHKICILGEALGCAAPASGGKVVAALRSGIYTFDTRSGERRPIAQPEAHLPGNRFNDGKCDPRGRFLAGTMDNAEKEKSGSLYSISPDGSYQRLLTGLGISNGMTWSPDLRTFYFIDTPTRQVMAYDYDLDAGGITNPRVAVRIPPEYGYPDGLTSDMEGGLWIAMWGGAQVVRWDASTGEPTLRCPLPALNVTACCFAGDELSNLYVTTARIGMTPEELEKYPRSGGLFRVQTGVRGMPTWSFGVSADKGK